jgi:heme/copper-type cytochrome/quinol oxidase subunit 2
MTRACVPAGGNPFQESMMAMNDEEQLDLLGIFHYIFGGLGIFGMLFPLIYVVLGVVFLIGPEQFGMKDGPKPEEAALMGGFFLVFGLVLMVIIGSVSACVLYSGRCLRQRRNRTFSMVIAAITCLQIPLGTTLGVFTLIVLSRPDVNTLYEAEPITDFR